jgi:hypothetical protein
MDGHGSGFYLELSKRVACEKLTNLRDKDSSKEWNQKFAAQHFDVQILLKQTKINN